VSSPFFSLTTGRTSFPGRELSESLALAFQSPPFPLKDSAVLFFWRPRVKSLSKKNFKAPSSYRPSGGDLPLKDPRLPQRGRAVCDTPPLQMIGGGSPPRGLNKLVSPYGQFFFLWVIMDVRGPFGWRTFLPPTELCVSMVPLSTGPSLLSIPDQGASFTDPFLFPPMMSKILIDGKGKLCPWDKTS